MHTEAAALHVGRGRRERGRRIEEGKIPEYRRREGGRGGRQAGGEGEGARKGGREREDERARE